ncbi:uncharacterized protein LOC119385689 [Rhipicephalus sanguineus]|uniref:uncharacterized protein LOC119385689 n=1 Tax=Rhipicephalus sanguineus TaxID=34632 RepID=UPI0020C563BE|nr:uncharacterized protein LOC119385689 [Rhipicephalus sanguineus]
MPTCCASGCKSRYSKGKKLFSLPRGKDNAARQEVWLQRIGRTDLDPVSSRLCEDHFSVDQFEPILLRKFGTKKLKRDATPTIFSQQHSQTSEYNDSARSSCGFNLLLTAAAVVDEAEETHCPSATNVLLTPAAVDGHTATDSAPLYFPEDAPSSSECDALPACSTACSAGVETTHESSYQPFQALMVPVESQQNFRAACGGFLSAEGTADVSGKCSVLLFSHTMQYTRWCDT